MWGAGGVLESSVNGMKVKPAFSTLAANASTAFWRSVSALEEISGRGADGTAAVYGGKRLGVVWAGGAIEEGEPGPPGVEATKVGLATGPGVALVIGVAKRRPGCIAGPPGGAVEEAGSCPDEKNRRPEDGVTEDARDEEDRDNTNSAAWNCSHCSLMHCKVWS